MQHLINEDHLGSVQSLLLRSVHRRRFLLTAFASAAVAGCAPAERLPSAAANLTERTTVLGIPNARFYADTQVAEMVQEAQRGRP
jgi:hypothetical protein